MSDSFNRSNFVTSSTRPNPSTSSNSTHAVNGGSLNGNDQAQRTTPTGSNNINSDHQARDNGSNDQNGTLPSAVGTAVYTDDPAVRRFHKAFHTDESHPRGPSTLASDLMRQMNARDRQQFGLQPDASHNSQSATSEPDSFDLFDTPSSAIPPVAVTDTPITLGVSQDDDFNSSGAIQHGPPLANSSGSPIVSQAADFTAFGFHASDLPSYPIRRSTPSSGGVALSSHPLGEASNTPTIFNSTPLINERPSNSDQRPSYDLTALGLRGEPVLDNGITPNSQLYPTTDNSNTAERAYDTIHSGADGIHGQAEHSNGGVDRTGHGRARAAPNTPMDDAPSTNVSDLRLGPVSRERLNELAPFSQYPEDESNTAAPNEHTTENSSFYLTDYMEEPSAEERERPSRAFDAAPVESNARPNVPSASPTQSDQQDRASSAVNNSIVNSRDRRAPRTGGSLRRLNTEENEFFWSEFDNFGNSRGSG